ncbi:X-box-binding protein 1 isoform X2 [Chelonia mydas]|uniref:X-box-binding protein 1 isoform X2 n=1 Tax=Chelonia mydas TaxID=8469 RepID=UPI001CA91CF1|nr:X-box-binding protein 1 isoform X2 [Chelonia mydas]
MQQGGGRRRRRAAQQRVRAKPGRGDDSRRPLGHGTRRLRSPALGLTQCICALPLVTGQSHAPRCLASDSTGQWGRATLAERGRSGRNAGRPAFGQWNVGGASVRSSSAPAMAALPGSAAPRLLLIPGQAAEPLGAAASRPLSVALPVGGPRSPSPEPQPPARKRQRLTHLSPEEKALRRKLKNRVAAQSARDRKKARMSELEQQVLELEQENQNLLLENQLLREKTQGLAVQNQELRYRLGLDAPETEEERAPEVVMESQVDEIRMVTGSAESAALRLRVPLQQVQAQQSPLLTVSTWMLMALTLQTLSLISCWAFWTAWTQTCSSGMVIRSHRAWKSWRKKSVEKNQIPYQPPPLPLWGPHQPSWRPLMN